MQLSLLKSAIRASKANRTLLPSRHLLWRNPFTRPPKKHGQQSLGLLPDFKACTHESYFADSRGMGSTMIQLQDKTMLGSWPGYLSNNQVKKLWNTTCSSMVTLLHHGVWRSLMTCQLAAHTHQCTIQSSFWAHSSTDLTASQAISSKVTPNEMSPDLL